MGIGDWAWGIEKKIFFIFLNISVELYLSALINIQSIKFLETTFYRIALLFLKIHKPGFLENWVY